MRPTFCALAVMLVLVLGACGGQSSQDKAKSTVCDARSDIGKQVDQLKALTPSTVTTSAVTESLSSIRDDLKNIAGAQSELSDARRSEVQAANKAFTSSIQTIATQVVTSLSAADAKTALTTALQQLGTSYQEAFTRVDCS